MSIYIRKTILIIFIFYSFYQITLAQGEIDDGKKVFYRNERTYGFLLNTNGFGFDYRFAKRINAARKKTYELGFNYVKHSKEKKISNPNLNSRFVFGKLNFCLNFYAGYGRQREYFRKIDKGGISIRFFYFGELSLMVLKPIYYEIYTLSEIKIEKFSTTNSNSIIGKASFFKGFGETKIFPGGNLKLGVSFEYSKKDRKVRAIEAGINFNVYSQKIEILAADVNNQFIISLFLSYRIGKVIRGGHIKDREDENLVE